MPLPPPPTSGARPPPAPLPPPAPPPGAEAKKGRKAVDMDWDDEEESTHVYDGKPIEPAPTGPRPAAGAPPPAMGAAAALLSSSGGAARPVPAAPPAAYPAPPPRHSAAPSVQLPPVATQTVPSKPYRVEEETIVRPRPTPPSGGSKAGVILGGLSLAVVLALAVFIFLPRKGQLVVDVKSKTGAAIGKAEIFIDGQKKCDTVPCVLADLEPGSKVIKVIAPDHAPKDVTENVEAGKENRVFIDLETGTSDTAASSTAPGLKIAGNSAVKVFVDGTDKGNLPLDLKDIKPGSHKLRFEGGNRYEKLEQTVNIEAGQLKDLGTIKLKVLKGLVTLDLATTGATVKVISQGPKRIEKRIADGDWRKPPVKLDDLEGSETWKVIATKRGFDNFEQEVSFEDGVAEKSVRIELNEAGRTPPVSAPVGPSDTKTADTKTTDTKSSGSGTATLNLNSIPVSKVVLDGKPLGSTPKVGVSVPAGSHSVRFIHPDLGTKSVSVTVKAGETKTAAVKFK
jgi:serine/threonine-protein kinase